MRFFRPRLRREDDPQVPRQLRQPRHRRPLPAHLPREINRLEPEESSCPECGGEQRPESDPHRTGKKACTKYDYIVEAPLPSRPIEHVILPSNSGHAAK